MKLLLDQGLPRSTVAHLAQHGIVAEHVGALGLAAATDEAILDRARLDQAIVVTLDADFHQLLAVSGAVSPSVVRVRVEGLNGEQLADLLVAVLAAASAELASGAVASVNLNRLRLRHLPITG